MIAAPVMAALLIDLPAERVSAIAYASVSGLSATLGFITCFGHMAARKYPWYVCLAAAGAAFVLIGAILHQISLPLAMQVAIGCASPWIARWLLPRIEKPKAAPVIPKQELWFRIVGAALMAAVLIFSADQVAPWLSGLLIAWPITGSILPSFTQRMNGPNATVALLLGFTRGLVGFSVFFVLLGALLNTLPKAAAYGIAIGAAALVAYLLARKTN